MLDFETHSLWKISLLVFISFVLVIFDNFYSVSVRNLPGHKFEKKWYSLKSVFVNSSLVCILLIIAPSHGQGFAFMYREPFLLPNQNWDIVCNYFGSMWFAMRVNNIKKTHSSHAKYQWQNKLKRNVQCILFFNYKQYADVIFQA